ncbi:DNA translocase FtsK [Lysinibacillus xylanilyticus]|uniref:DNA translocase FtsK n=1 Tax=Lysinibacillus xylanilyticus TaxID=582475 RepID=UPI00382227F6
MLQRNLRNAYVRSGRLDDTLEELGVVSPTNDSKPLNVFVNDLEDVQDTVVELELTKVRTMGPSTNK